MKLSPIHLIEWSLSAFLSLLVYSWLPETVVTHWGISGEPNGFSDRLVAVWLFPVMMGILLIMFAVLPRLDPLGRNLAGFRQYYDRFTATVLGLLLYMQLLVVAWNLGFRFPFISAFAPALMVLFFVTGTVLEKTERNWLIGIRTPWTMSSDRVWRATHRRVAPLFKLGSTILLAGVIFPRLAFPVLIVWIAVVVLAGFGISYMEYRKITPKRR